MAEKEIKKDQNKYREGIPMSEESLKDYNQTWIDMDDCFEKIDKECNKG